jgi:hypothetical protein
MKNSLAVIAIILLAPMSAAAQVTTAPFPAPANFRGFISFDGGYQTGTDDFASDGTFTQHQEQASFEADHELSPGPQFQASGAVGIWRTVYAGVAVSRFSRRTPTRVTGSIPHPFFFSRNRAIEGEAAGLKREELAVHLQARAVVPAGERLSVTVFGGPSWFSVKQGVVSGVSFTEAYPFDTAQFRAATTSSASKSRIGYHVGADVAFFFTRHLGVGAGLQVAGAELEVPAEGAGPVTINAGGIQSGAGLRMRF